MYQERLSIFDDTDFKFNQTFITVPAAQKKILLSLNVVKNDQKNLPSFTKLKSDSLILSTEMVIL